MCVKHYKRWKKHGDPLKVLPHGYRGTPEERFWPKVDKNGPIPEHAPHLGRCWVWTGASNHGYGVFYATPAREQPDGKQRLMPAHQFSYELHVRPVPDGFELDHLCRNHACVNPEHLDPVTHHENILRGVSPAAEHARRETCPEGHDYDVIETRPNGRTSRRCSLCDNKNQRERPPCLSGPIVACECGCGATFPEKLNGRARRWVKDHYNKRAA